jgi:putative transposase
MWEEGYQAEELCQAFELSKSGYYTVRKRPLSDRAKENEAIVSTIKEIHDDRHLKAYDSAGMTTELQAKHGFSCSENRVARLMATHDIQVRYDGDSHPKKTTQDSA